MYRLALLGLLLFGAWSARAVVVTPDTTLGSAIIPGNNDFFGGFSLSGVVMVTNSSVGCSGALIGDYTVLTAAHCVESAPGAGLYANPQVSFLPPANTTGNAYDGSALGVSSIAVDPSWNGSSSLGTDLAVIHLSQAAPNYATRYSLYTGMVMPATSPVILAGFGQTGTGATGATGGFGYLRAGTNEYAVTGAAFGWSSNLLIGQFYLANNTQFYDANHNLIDTNALGVADPYSSGTEVMIAHGDSGGPTFYNGQIIGVHDIGICMSTTPSSPCLVGPSISPSNNSYFGQMWGDVSVAGNAAFLDQQLAPEPASAMLVMLGLSLAAWRRWRSVA